MMQVIRDKAHGVVAWVIVAMIAFVFCFWGVSSYLAPSSSPWLAKVNSRKITVAQVDDVYDRWLRYNSMQKDFDAKKIDSALIKQQITRAMAQQMAMVSSLQHDGFTISESMVIDSIRSNPQLQENGEFSIQKYKEALSQMNVDEATFETVHREELLLNQIQLAILTSSFSTPSEAAHIIAIKDQKRDFGYTIIPAAKYSSSAKISAQAIEEFYNAHKSQFMMPEKVQLEYIELSVNDLIKQLPITDAKLHEYYENNLQSFNDPKVIRLQHIMISAPKGSDADRNGEAFQKIEAIYSKLQSGADFAEIAKKESEDKPSAVSGGNLGWVSKNDSYPIEVFELKVNGDYTKPVQSDYGWHVFMLAETKGGGVKGFDSVKSAVLERYKREAVEQLFSSKAEELANLTFENPTSLGVASEKLHLPIATTKFFTRQGGNGIAASANVLNAAFSDTVLIQQHNSDLIRLSDDSYVVIRIKEKQPEQEQPLESVQADIGAHLKLIAGRDIAKKSGDDLIISIKQDNNPSNASSKLQLQWKTLNKVERDTKGIDPLILQHAFAMSKPTGDKQPSVAGFGMPNGDYVVMALNSVVDASLPHSEDSDLIDTMTKQIAVVQGRLEFAAMQNALLEQAKIKYLN